MNVAVQYMKHTTDNSSTTMNKCIHGFKLENVKFRSL
jgi:hypothetical protein